MRLRNSGSSARLISSGSGKPTSKFASPDTISGSSGSSSVRIHVPAPVELNSFACYAHSRLRLSGEREMLDDKTLTVVETVSILQRRIPDMQSKLSEDPTSFVTGVLQDADVQVADGFHVHILDEGEDIPEEPNIGTMDREVYLFHRNGQIERKVVKGSPTGNDAVLKAGRECCDCLLLCCIIWK